ncbi:sigma-54-dependent Fis family transcriptional regulator [Vulcanibacillus modesticaldus]|uniref:Sigma-54-dependent Fis family transcriptional regulator n=1 Tax=Vulcanibacillus modesticaldus TaxID=337097 RepID=A0A1D2YSJ7_9BACI|nr:sigma 54-interacting transcriptional regulator [Vulcanibacillus modesticaldus]OEF97305.1 sigma-54-dependent Fis family transcriptional regulator [Vulcanibacillus modesticaldus]
MLEAILGTIDEGIHVVNQEGITIFYNHVAAKHDGLQVEEVLNRHLFDVFPSLNRESSTLLKVIETGRPIINQHQQYTNKNGLQVVTVNTTLPIIVNGKLVGAVEIAKDISKIKHLSEKLIDLQSQVKAPVINKSSKVVQAKFQFNDIITQDPKMKKLIELAKKASFTDSPILIEGETGTGKELFVQSIHNHSPRRDQPFIAQNCAAIPVPLLEGILFGTVKGSFTGAENRPGLFELAHNGTLFLDEINSMPIELQAKLLRVLQDGIVRRVGDTFDRRVNVRVIVATNVNPIEAVKNGAIRSDLYYRINVVHLKIPPLRERLEDIPLLSKYFIQKYNYRFQKLIIGVSPQVEKIFQKYFWPGNVRELEHVIEYAMNIIEGDTIELLNLPEHLQSLEKEKDYLFCNDIDIEDKSLRDILDNIEKELITKALKVENNNIKKAAKRLKIPRQTLQYKIMKYFK